MKLQGGRKERRDEGSYNDERCCPRETSSAFVLTSSSSSSDAKPARLPLASLMNS